METSLTASTIVTARPAARTSFVSGLGTALMLIGMMLIPVFLSVFFFMGQSLRLDESQSLWQTSRSVGYIFFVVAQDVHVPLYHIILHFWMLYLGNTITVARTLSLVFYIISIPALYMLGKRAYGHTIGLFAAFLFSISPFMNWYGNEIRMYTLFTLLVIINQYFFIQLFKTDKQNDTTWALYILTALFGIYSHYFFFLSLASQVVFFVLRRDLFPPGSLRRFMIAAAVCVAAIVPWLIYVLHLGQVSNQTPLLATPTSVNLFSTVAQFLVGFQNDNINTFFLSLWPVTVLFALLTLRKQTGRMEPESQYFLTTLVVSLAIAFAISFIISPVFVSRYLIFTVPSLYLLLASLFSNYSIRFGSLMRWTVALLMIAALGVEILSPTTPVKENYEEATNYLNAHVTAQDAVVLSAPFTVYPVEYYYRAPAPIVTLPVWDQYAYGAIPAFTASDLPGQVKQDVGQSQNVYLLLSYNQGYESDIKNYFESHYKRIYEQTFSDDLSLYVYKLRYDTTQTAVSTTLK